MGVAKMINCHHLVNQSLGQVVLLMIVVQISRYCHH